MLYSRENHRDSLVRLSEGDASGSCLECLTIKRRNDYGNSYRAYNIAAIYQLDEHERLLGFRAYYVLYLLRAYVHRSVARRAGEEEKEPRILRKEVSMFFFLFVAILISVHYPIVGICLISPFVVFGVVFLIGGIIKLIKTEKEINQWKRRYK